MCNCLHSHFVIIGGSYHQYNFCRDKYVFVATKDVFCGDKSMLAATKLLLRQNIFVVTKHVTTNIILSRQMFYQDKSFTCLSQQNVSFLATKLCKYHFCRDQVVYLS